MVQTKSKFKHPGRAQSCDQKGPVGRKKDSDEGQSGNGWGRERTGVGRAFCYGETLIL